MRCTMCGAQIGSNEKFCSSCGSPIAPQQAPSSQTLMAETNQNMPQQQYNYGGQITNNQPLIGQQANAMYPQQMLNNQQTMNNFQQAFQENKIQTDPTTRKWSILSILIGGVAILVYWFIGLTPYIAIIISSIGFNFARKGTPSGKVLSTIGTIVNVVLLVMAVIMWISNIIGLF